MVLSALFGGGQTTSSKITVHRYRSALIQTGLKKRYGTCGMIEDIASCGTVRPGLRYMRAVQDWHFLAYPAGIV
jgi:hypothetical protein